VSLLVGLRLDTPVFKHKLAGSKVVGDAVIGLTK
jgi:hypothetical protein